MTIISSALFISCEVQANINCLGLNWKTNLPDTICEKNEISVKTNNKNSYLRYTAELKTPVKLSVTIEDPMFMHWAGIEINKNIRLKINNENRRLELLIKSDTWKVIEFVDAYHVLKQKDNEIQLSIYLENDNVIVWIDEIKVIDYQLHNVLEGRADVALVSGWKSNIKWKQISFESVDKILLKKQYKKINNSCEIKNISLDNNNHVYEKDEVINIHFYGDCGSDVTCAVYNMRGNLLSEVVANTSANEKTIKRYKCAILPDRYGTHTIKAFIKDHKNTLNLVDLAVVAVLPDVSGLIRSESYFGGHIDGIDPDWHIDTALDIGLGWVRAHDGIQVGWWTRVQPNNRDEWLWPYDKMIETLAKDDISVLGGLLWSPSWMNKKGKAYPPEDMMLYKKYVRKVVSRYKSTISHWEVWNEPYFKYYWKGTAVDYVDLVKNSMQAIKSVNKDFKVVAGVLSPFESGWNRAVFDAGLLHYVDILSIHFSEIDYSDSVLSDFINDVRKRGFDGEIWNTEARVYSQDNLTNHDNIITENSRLYHSNASVEIIKLYLENISHGITKVFYYHQINPDRRRSEFKASDNDKAITSAMWSRGNNPKSMVSTYTSLIKILDGSRFKEKIERFNSLFYLFSKQEYAVAVQLHEGEVKQCQPIDDALNQLCEAKLYDSQANNIEKSLSPVLDNEPWYLVCHGDNSAQNLKQIVMQLSCQ